MTNATWRGTGPSARSRRRSRVRQLNRKAHMMGRVGALRIVLVGDGKGRDRPFKERDGE